MIRMPRPFHGICTGQQGSKSQLSHDMHAWAPDQQVTCNGCSKSTLNNDPSWLQASENGAGGLPNGELVYKAPSGMQKFATSLRLIRALPWRRFKKGSVLVIEVIANLWHLFIRDRLACLSHALLSHQSCRKHATTLRQKKALPRRGLCISD